MLTITDVNKLRLRPPQVKNTTLRLNTFIVKAPNVWNQLVGQILFKETINVKIFQMFGRLKKPSIVTLKSKLLDISLSVSSTKHKLKELLLKNQSAGGIDWIDANNKIPKFIT